jgi:glycine betaine/proline transport system ATP-binding protein
MDRTARKVILSCRSVWKLYGSNTARFKQPPTERELRETKVTAAVRDASFDIGRGEIFVVMGLSGSGKSTLVRCLSRLTEPSLGSVMFDGRNLMEMSQAELKDVRRHKMGMVFQNFALLPHLTVLGNVAFPLHIQGMAAEARTAKALEMIRLVGLVGRENYFPHELSGGQQQRVGIARSLAVDPDVWFLDEPFSALDPLIRREMQDEFLRLQKTLNKTIVFITHDFDEAVRLADRIALMKDGHIVQIGTPEELLLDPATDYVKAFTKSVPRSRVLSARTIMTPVGPGRRTKTLQVHSDEKIQAVAALMLGQDDDVTVVDADNLPVGIIEKRTMFEALAGAA